MDDIPFYTFQYSLFLTTIYLIYFLNFIILFKLFPTAHKYLSQINSLLSIYISLFLIIRFNPFSHSIFTTLDKKIAFSAGLSILFTSSINTLLSPIITKTLSNIHLRTFTPLEI